MAGVHTVLIYPHTHWDREWYEPEHRFRQRLVPMFSTALDLLESDAAIRVFLLDGQTSLVDDYLAIQPEDEHRIRTLAHQGRLLLGPWYVLADEFLTSDESLVRNLLCGKAAGARYGHWMPVGYCPDSFGHPAALPSILCGFGISSAVLWRGYGRSPTDPDLFRWIAADGATVLTHHLPPDGYEVGAELPTDYGQLLDRWNRLRDTLFPRARTGVVLLPNGADHHALQPDIAKVVEHLRDIEKDIDIRIASPEEYFAEVAPSVRDAPVVRGELRDSYGYTWTLQGVHSTRSRLKRLMAEGERLLVRWAEPQCALAVLAGGKDRRSLLRHAWLGYLQSCAHDSIGGCCTDAVARDVTYRAARAIDVARTLFVDSMMDRAHQNRVTVRRSSSAWQARLLVINPSPFVRSGVVEATVTLSGSDVVVGRPGEEQETPSLTHRAFRLLDARGEPVPYQELGRYMSYDRIESPRDYPDQDLVEAVRILLSVSDVPALGFVALDVSDPVPAGLTGAGLAEDRSADLFVTDTRIVSRDVTVSIGLNAYDVADDEFSLSGVFDVISEADLGDTYTFQPDPHDVPVRAEWAAPTTVHAGPYVGCLARTFDIPGRAAGTVYARVDAASSVVGLIVEGVNRSGNHRLRVLFPLPDEESEEVVVDQHFGPVVHTRPESTGPVMRQERRVASAPCHRYVSVSAGRPAFTVFPRGVFEYELTPAHVAFTVLRAVGWISRGDLPARPGHVAWPEATPEAQELGSFRAEFGFLLDGVPVDAEPAEWKRLESHAESFHAPLTSLMLRRSINVPAVVSGPTLSGDGLILKALKPAEQGNAVVLRCVNVSMHATSATIRWPERIGGAARVRLDESVIEDLTVADDGRTLRLEVLPREIVSLLIWI